MSYPEGLELVNVTAGPSVDFFGEDRAMVVLVSPILGGHATRLVWGPTSTTVVAVAETFRADAGAGVTFQLPHPDQAGMHDGAGNSVRNWAYRATVSAGGHTWTKSFQVVVGQTSMALEDVPDHEVAAPTVAPLPLVTSVNGQTGNVVVEGGGGSAGLVLSLAEYEALEPPDPSTMYYIRRTI